ncbi:MAG: cardiolipin synthase B [Acidobacteria bacterium]|nr:cardiolipin synthase B [Acidobacteriota bacterium]
MPTRTAVRPGPAPRDLETLRTLADQAFSRAAGAPLITGNHVDVLRDATENYPAWERAIERARRSIHVEMYIVHRDAVGRRFVEALAAKAREGIAVRVIYDWFGCGLGPLRGLFSPLVAAGGEVRAFNPPALSSALGWLRRNHRKLLTVDGEIAFVSGLCIGQLWLGIPEKGLAPWRDTGLAITGPAVTHAEAAFADSWRLVGGTPSEVPLPTFVPPAGDVSLRLIPTEPFTANLFRLDLLVAALARQSLWITDAYFVGPGPYLEGLKRAARDGVDVRLLLPRNSDVGWVVPLSRSLYRPLLEAGVRIFEWNGTMIHAKTAIADQRWARIGSTNLNITSWIGNWEMDVAIEHEGVASTLAAQFEDDLARSTEIVLGSPRPAAPRPRRLPGVRAGTGYKPSRRVMRTVAGVGRTFGAALTGSRRLEDFEVQPVVWLGLLLVALAVVVFFVPWLLAWPLAAVATWFGVALLVEAWTVWRQR